MILHESLRCHISCYGFLTCQLFPISGWVIDFYDVTTAVLLMFQEINPIVLQTILHKDSGSQKIKKLEL